ncbi:hypothetical protein [Achromobacter sp. ESBL13]|uniref:hypothetical protein n=1 Tax=Achromobacter sp. ESBL13 TaxID=3077328 RepID=UPI002FC907BF
MDDVNDIGKILGKRQEALDAIKWDEDEQEYQVPAMGAAITVPKSYLGTPEGQLRQILRLLEKGATQEMVLAFAHKVGMKTGGPF